MDTHPSNPIDLTSEAILELEELRQKIRSDSPALEALFKFLLSPTPAPAFQGNESISMLADVRSYALFRDSLSPAQRPRTADFHEFQKFIEQYLWHLKTLTDNRDATALEEAKVFFIALNENLLSRRLTELYKRRDRTNSQYVDHDDIL